MTADPRCAADEACRCKTWAMALLVVGLPLGVYVATLTPTVLDGDLADLARQSYTLGLAYPSGFPINGILGKVLTTVLCVGPLGWRAHLLGALAGAGAVLFGWLTLRRWDVPPIAAAMGMWLLAFSPLFWAESIHINAYIVNVCIGFAVIYLLAVWTERRRMGLLACAAALYGFGLGGHASHAAYAPVFAGYVAWQLARDGWKRVAVGLAVMGGAGLAGCIPWLSYTTYYIAQGGGHDGSVAGVARRVVAFLMEPITGRPDWQAGRSAAQWQWRPLVRRGILHGARTVTQFSPVGVALAAVGFCTLWRRRAAWGLLCGAYAIQVAFAVFMHNHHLLDSYRLSSLALLALFMGVGLGAVWRRAGTPGRRVAACAVLAALTIGVPHALVYVAPIDWDSVGHRMALFRPEVPFQNDFAIQGEADGRAALEHMPAESLVIATWGPYSTLRYLHEVDGLCPGARVLCLYGGAKNYRKQLSAGPPAAEVFIYVRNGQTRLHDWAETELSAAEVVRGALHTLYRAPIDARAASLAATRRQP
ncbi:DUF2723 domain-containing protein [bacterium]|nr:DUF2723 domain-containing protein [bacterium]